MQESLEKIWSEHGKALASFIKRRAGSIEAASDILQDVAVKMVGNGEIVARADNPRAWLHAVARNAVIDHYRRRRPMAELDPELPGPEPETHDVEEIARCLAPLIAAVPETLRHALVLADMEGLRQSEVASRLGISLPAAKSRVLRGRADLRRRIEACCALAFDTRGSLMDYTPRRGGCSGPCGSGQSNPLSSRE